MTSIDPEKVKIALSFAEGTPFEKFANAFFSDIRGFEFVPLGGTGDGGADAYIEKSNGENPTTFFQASVVEDIEGKIKNTLERLREVKRDPRTLYYLTSQKIPMVDRVEDALSESFKVSIKIKDREYFANHINNSAGTKLSFEYIKHYLRALDSPGDIDFIPRNNLVANPAVYVFLRQESDARTDKSTLIECMTDSLILWALEDTSPDPDNLKLMSFDQIKERIGTIFLEKNHWLLAKVEERLKELCKKESQNDRKIRHHTKENAYCLPYETRQIIQKENTEDKSLQDDVIDIFRDRISRQNPKKFQQRQLTEMAKVTLKAIQLTFELEGVAFAGFLASKEVTNSYDSIANQVDLAIEEFGFKLHGLAYREAILLCLRDTFYKSHEKEKLYLEKLAKTYSLLFTLQLNVEVVKFFEGMASNFNLILGTDILVRALTERYLEKKDQQIRNLLEMLRMSGTKLYLTDDSLRKVHTHIEATDWEFNNHFRSVEKHLTSEIAGNSNKILIRSYFYAKLNPVKGITPPYSWEAYISQFCSYPDLHKSKGENDIRAYLTKTLGLEYLDEESIDKTIISQENVTKLTEKLMEIKDNRDLAERSARIVLTVYGLRKAKKETPGANVYGLKTWCMSNEKKIMNLTHYLVEEMGETYLMRPEFLLNFISMSPKMRDVKKAFKEVFPTLLGIRLGNRVDPKILHDMLKKLDESKHYEPARLEVVMSEICDKLKGDFGKKYEVDTLNFEL